MSAKTFVDTNIVLYAFDMASPEKQVIAKALMHEKPAISTQVLSEFTNVCIKKKLQSPADLSPIIESIARITSLQLITLSTVKRALEIASGQQFSYYDSLIVASALEAGVEILYTEDMQHRRNIESLTIVNPFI